MSGKKSKVVLCMTV